MAIADHTRITPSRAVSSARLHAIRWELGALVVLAAALELWNLSLNGFANDYYSAAVRSMTESWHNFLFISFDPAGVMTVDKPPLSLWVQALSAKVFGFSSWSLLVPQALMTIGSVVLLYDLVRRRFGRVGGTVAGLALALTPMTVAIGRHNNPDALLVLCCVAALWFLVRALEDGRTKWVVWCGVMVGLGFETKMAAALLVVPALAAAFFWVAPRGRLAAARSLAWGGAAMAVVGGAWPLLVSLVPASNRPWISGTADNNVWSLIFGYNGLGRLDGQAGGPGGAAGGPGGGGVFGGETGPFRLLHESLGGQAGWLLGFALVAAVALVVVSRLRRSDARTGWVIAVAGCFATCAVAFSFAEGIFHPYYVSQLAPFTAALVGAGVAQLAARGPGLRILAPIAIVAGVAVELVVIDQDATNATWAIPVLVAGALVAVGLLALRSDGRTRMIAMAVAVAALLAAPAAWSFQTLGHATQGTFPAGGPESSGGFGGGPGGGGRMGPPGMGAGGFAPGGATMPGGTTTPGGATMGGPGMGGPDSSLNEVITYVNAHGGGTIGVSSQMGAGSAVLEGADVAGIGGFSGRESQVSATWLADAVDDGRIRWVLAEAQGGPFGGGSMGNDGRVGANDVMTLVQNTCEAVDTGSSTVYDCQGYGDALRAGA